MNRESVEMPGQIIQAELDRRGWTHADLAEVIGRYRTEVTGMISGKRGISPELAELLGAALGGGFDYWINLEMQYRKSRMKQRSTEVERRLRIKEFAPTKLMAKRGWINESDDLEKKETELCRFFGVSSLDESPSLSINTKRSTERLTTAQRAWCFRVKQIATALQVNPFRAERIDSLSKSLRRFAAYPKEASHVAEAMQEFGIRFVVVEPLPGGKIDGVTMWINSQSPVIAVSIRYDRIDHFWFTLFHEVLHVKESHDLSIDTDIMDAMSSGSEDEIETRANEYASSTLVPKGEFESFVRRTAPLYSDDKIIRFSNRIKIHPGIVVGQIHHREPRRYRYFREMLKPVREYVTSTALTDGWGKSISPTVFQ